MGALSEIQATIAAQNQAVAAQANQPPPVESAEKPAPQTAEEGKRAAQVDQQPTDNGKSERKAKLDSLRKLAEATESKFSEAQALSRAREKAEGEVAELRTLLEKAETRTKEYESKLARIDADPWSYMQKDKGIKLRDLAERIAKSGTPDAAIEEIKQQLIAQHEAHEAEVARLRQEIEQSKKEAAEKETRLANDARNAQLKAAFLSDWEKGRSKWAYIERATDGDTNDVIREWMVTYQDIKADPKTAPYIDEYTNDEIFEATNQRLENLAKKLVREQAAAAAGAGATAAKPTLTDAKPTLTTASAVEPAAIPVDFKKLPPKEQKKAMAEMYRSLRKSG